MEQHGWRWSFAAFGVASLAWAVVLFIVGRRVSRRAAPAQVAATPTDHRAVVADAVKAVVTSPLLLGRILGFSGLIFVMVGYLTWTPSLLYERFGLSLSEAGFFAVLHHQLFAGVGLLATGVVADRLVARFPKIRLLAMSAGLALFGPFLWLAGVSHSVWLVYAGLAGFGLFRGVYDANLFAAIFDAVDNRLRSTVTGIVVAVAYVAGAASPSMMGALKARYGLEGGFNLLAVVAMARGLVFFGIVLFSRVRPVDGPGSGRV